MPQEERDLLTAYLIRHSPLGALAGEGSQIAVGTTVKAALEEQRAWIQEQKRKQDEAEALAVKIRAEQEAQSKALIDAVTVALLSSAVQKQDFRAQVYSDRFVFKMAFRNNTQRDILGIKGNVRFSDMFDTPIKELSLVFENGVKVGETAQWTGVHDLNMFIDSDKTLAATPLDKLKAKWFPQAIIFADGSTMSINP
jgi:hypothetical protein